MKCSLKEPLAGSLAASLADPLYLQGPEPSLPVGEVPGASVSRVEVLLFLSAMLWGGRRFSTNPNLLDLREV